MGTTIPDVIEAIDTELKSLLPGIKVAYGYPKDAPYEFVWHGDLTSNDTDLVALGSKRREERYVLEVNFYSKKAVQAIRLPLERAYEMAGLFTESLQTDPTVGVTCLKYAKVVEIGHEYGTESNGLWVNVKVLVEVFARIPAPA